MLNENKAHTEQIYNIYEIGLPINRRPLKVVALHGKKKVCYQCSGSNTQITILGCCSGTGQVIPHFIVFDAK